MAVFDISQLAEQNPWWIDKINILSDVNIIKLSKLNYKWKPRVKKYIKLGQDVIYTIRGPRQVGKTTLLKIIIQDLLSQGINPESIFYSSFENKTAEQLNKIVQTYLDWRLNAPQERKYLFLDEICAVKDWSKELIHFANKGAFVNCSIIVTGSHSMDLKHSTELMPGRRGGDGSTPLDKILLPMKFSEFVELLWPEFKQKMFDLGIIKWGNRKKKILELFSGKIEPSIQSLAIYQRQLDALLETYLLTGGIPAVINEFKKTNQVSTGLFTVYLNAIIGDLHRYNYKELYFKQIVREIFNVLSNPISWNSFTKTTDIKHHDTIQEYFTALEELYVANISYSCSPSNKKINSWWKKIYIQDPFIFHALHGWANNKRDYFSNAKANILNLDLKGKLIESLVYSHLCRFSYSLNPRDLFDPKDNVFYYRDNKNKEVDFVVIFDGKYYPFEVKYQTSIAGSDFVAFKSFNKGVLINKNELGMYRHYVKIPVSIFLMLI